MMAAGGTHRSPAATASWFQGAPVSKAFSTIIAALYVTAEMSKIHDAFVLDFDRAINDAELWRFVTCHLTFSSVGELLFGLLLLVPLMRRFEREMGSRKFGTFAVFSTCLATSWEILLSQILLPSSSSSTTTIAHRASGPYCLIGSTLYLFHAFTPRLHPRFVAFLGFDFSEKALTYFLAFQLLFSQGLLTIVPTLCGFVAGYLCTSHALPLKKLEMPDVVYRVCGRIGAPFMERPPPVLMAGLRRRQMQQQNMRQPLIPPPGAHFQGMGGAAGGGAGGGGMRQQMQQHQGDQADGAGAGAAAQPPTQFQNLPPPPPPPEEVVENLTAMGFEREAVIRVLQQCDNNLEVAANRLLSEG